MIWVDKDPRLKHDIAGYAAVIWEVCLNCGSKTRIPFELE